MRRDFDPSTIGPFTIIETVESCAFSVTYRAERKGLGRTVLIRTLKPTVPITSPYAAELRREATILGMLEQPSIRRLYDFQDTDDALYLVLEDVRGATLRALIEAGQVELDAALAIVLALAQSLAHVHEKGIAHRALRPGVVTLLASGHVSLADFSFALASDAASKTSAEPMLSGDRAARLDYQAPELIVGDVGGPPADVWSLGVIFQELLAGAKPFGVGDGKTITQRIRNSAPEQLPDGVPAPVARIVGRCLSRSPEDRYVDARAVRDALSALLLARSTMSADALIIKALASAKLGDPATLTAGAIALPRRASAGEPNVGAAFRSLGIVAALIVAGGAAIQGLSDRDPVSQEGVPAGTSESVGPRDRGAVRVVARPWAEVYINGELIDVTPIGRPLLVRPGKHYVTFRHPKAPDEERTIKIAGGQTVFLDVTMRVDRGLGDGGVDAGRDAAESP